MAMNFEELDAVTRRFMRAEFDAEEAVRPYRSPRLSAAAAAAFADVMRTAIDLWDEVHVQDRFVLAHHWHPTETYQLKGSTHTRAINPIAAAELLGLGEFNTWYVRGLAARLLDEGETVCEVYRASEPKFTHASCSSHEGRTYRVQEVYDGHRRGYWPPGHAAGFSIPAGPGCHHTIRRIPTQNTARP